GRRSIREIPESLKTTSSSNLLDNGFPTLLAFPKSRTWGSFRKDSTLLVRLRPSSNGGVVITRRNRCEERRSSNPASASRPGGSAAMFRKNSVVLLAFIALVFWLLGFAQTAKAQVLFGSVSGTVTDQSGAAVPKAHISSVNKATGVQRETDADDSGHYRL